MRKTGKTYRVTLVLLSAILLAAFVTIAASAGTASYKRSGNAWLGIYMQEMDRDLAEAFNLDLDEGVFVDDVVDDSPADEAGIRSRDVIVQFGGKIVRDPDDLSDLMEDYDPGDEVKVMVSRDGEEKEFTVELGKDSFSNSFSIWNNGNRYLSSDYFDVTLNNGGYLGVSTVELSRQLADYFGVKYGVLIEEVEKDSPASEAGLQAGDVITRVGIEQVDDPSDLLEIIRDHEEGDEVELTVYRSKQEMKITATLDESSGMASWSNRHPMSIRIPSVTNLPTLNGMIFDWDDETREEFEDEMDELREELKELQEELGDIREKLK